MRKLVVLVVLAACGVSFGLPRKTFYPAPDAQWMMNEYQAYPAGMIHRWPMNDNAASTAVLDFGGTANNGTLSDSSHTTAQNHDASPARGTGAITLSGSSSAITLASAQAADLAAIDTALTLSVWVKTAMNVSSDDGACSFIGKRNGTTGAGWFLGLAYGGVNNKPCFDVGNSVTNRVIGSATASTGEWTHLVGTFGLVSGWQITNGASALIAHGTAGRVVENIVYDSVTDRFWWAVQNNDSTAGGKITLAYSEQTGDGGTTATKLLADTWTINNAKGIVEGMCPHLVKFGSTWYLYFTYNNGGTYEISYMTCTAAGGALSTEATDWTAKVKILEGSPGYWDGGRADECYVFYNSHASGDKYYMLYMGEQAPNGGSTSLERTGFATAPAPTGPWTKYAVNPVLSGSLTGAHWNSGYDRAADPYAFQLDDTSNVWYIGVAGCRGAKTGWGTGFYSTTDFITYTAVSEANPILRPSGYSSGTTYKWDGLKTWRGAPIKVGTTWYIAYSGGSGDGTTYAGGIGILNTTGSSSIAKLYVNGVCDADLGTPLMAIAEAASNTYIGLAGGLTTSRFAGSLDDVMIFNTRLTDTEVAQIYAMNDPAVIYDSRGTTNGSRGDTWSRSVAGKNGRAQSFNGTEKIQIATSTLINPNGTPFTVSTWVYPTSVADNADIISKYDGTHTTYLLMRIGARPRFYSGAVLTNSPAIAIADMSINTWYHIVGVYDGTNTKIYVNGVFNTNATTPAAPVQSTTDLFLGMRSDETNPYSGYIDNVMYWNKALTAAQIKMLYSNGIGMEYWPLRELRKNMF